MARILSSIRDGLRFTVGGGFIGGSRRKAKTALQSLQDSAQGSSAGAFTPVSPFDGLDRSTLPFIGYCPWIPEHSDALICKLISTSKELAYRDVSFFRGQDESSHRHLIGREAENRPLRYRRLALSRLQKLKARGMRAMVFTLDWTPAMREIAFACRSLDIPTFLVPHESVFASETAYYQHPRRGTSTPVCDYVLCWGELQRRIFIDRGYPADRIIKVGSPKLDFDVSFKPEMDPALFRRMFGFPERSKVVLFAMQPMDNFGDKSFARDQQARAIEDALECCIANDYCLLVRTPPSRDKILPTTLIKRLLSSGCAALDEAGAYIVSPEEAMAQSNLVMSINSTMLFEARLMGTPSLATRYLPFDSIWDRAGIPFVRSADQMAPAVRSLVETATPMFDSAGYEWAVQNFSNAAFGFDNGSAGRIEETMLRLMGDAWSAVEISLQSGASGLIPGSVGCSPRLADEIGEEVLARAIRVNRVHRIESERDAAASDILLALDELDTRDLREYSAALGRPIQMLDQRVLAALRGEPAPLPAQVH